MAFLRSYAEQGDPWTFGTMRAGQLRGRPIALRPASRTRGIRLRQPTTLRQYLAQQARARALLMQGDPWKFGSFLKRAFKPITKAAKKWTWKGAAKAAGGLGRLAVQVAPLVPGLGTAVGGLAKAGGFVGTAARLGTKLAPYLSAFMPQDDPIGEPQYQYEESLPEYQGPPTRLSRSSPTFEEPDFEEEEFEELEDFEDEELEDEGYTYESEDY